MEVASGRGCIYRVLQSRCCSSLARPQQHVPVFFPCFLPAECAVRPGLLFGAATPEDRTGLRAVLGRGLPGPCFPCFLRVKGLSQLEWGSLGVVLPARPCPTQSDPALGVKATKTLCFGEPREDQG